MTASANLVLFATPPGCSRFGITSEHNEMGNAMPVIEESVFIARPPEAVFDFIVDPANLPVWDSSIVSAEQVGSGPFAAGSRSKGSSKIMGRRFDWTTESTECDRPNRLGYTSVDGPMDFSTSTVLEATDGGTQLTFRIDAESGLGGVFGRIADPLIVSVQSRTVRSSLENLAELLAEHPSA